MKRFAKYIKEYYGAGEVSSGQLQGHQSTIAIDDPVALDAINAYVGQIAEYDYVNPYTAVNKLWGSLSQLGLSFNLSDVHFDATSADKGVMELAMTRWGGRQGKDIDTPHTDKLDDDGVSHVKEGGLKLRLEYSYTENNRWHITGRLI